MYTRKFAVVSFWYFLLGCVSCITAQFNMSLYKRMPPLYTLDDYDACLDKDNGAAASGTYCMVYTEISPNVSSTLWQQIAEFSSDSKRHFRHDRLFFGVCMKQCQDLIKDLHHKGQNVMIGYGVEDIELLDYYVDVHKRESDERVRYEKIINVCLNYKFHQRYGLTLRSVIEYCETADSPLKYDGWDFTFFAFFGVIGIMTAASMSYDYHLRIQQTLPTQPSNFYKTKLDTTGQQLMTAFSPFRNYYRLIQPSRDDIANDLNLFNGLRVIGVFLVIMAHVLLVFMTVQTENPEFFEKIFYRSETSIIENGTPIIHVFFIISGFLLYMNFTRQTLITPTTSLSECIGVYWKIFVYRYLRLLPSLLAVILFNASLLTRMNDGPFWRHYTEAERTFCREYWWKNAFFVNNFMMHKSCAHHTWYIAADMQLFEFFTVVIIFTKKHVYWKKFTYYVISLLAVLVPATITYFLGLFAIYHSHPENYRYMFFKDAETFYLTYTPSYTNLGGYIGGILCAELYEKAKAQGTLQSYSANLKLQFSWWLLFPAAFGLLYFGAFFMSYVFDKPSLLEAIVAGVYRNTWIVICSAALLGMCFKLGWVAKEFVCLPAFRTLARISYQAYLWHVVVIRLLVGYKRQPIYVDRFYLLTNVILGFTITNIIAFFMALLVEYPIATVVRCWRSSINKSNGKS